MKTDGVVEWEGDMVFIVVAKRTNVADEPTADHRSLAGLKNL